MKKTISLLLLILSVACFGQNYHLFNSSSKKLFTDYPIAKNTYSIAFDSVCFNSNDSVYINFFKLSDTLFHSDTCVFWGGSDCIKQDVPVFMGKQIKNDSSFYKFYNLSNDSLIFRFTVNPLDTITFYSNATEKFLMIYQYSDTLSVLNIIDSSRFYKIINTDLNGNIINSFLNNQQIIISKDLGLVQFFQIDSFPQLLKPLRLLGNTNPDEGLHQITNEMLYDYQAGDEIQYREYYYDFNNPWNNNYTRYRKYTILNRTTTVDSIIYLVQQDFFGNNPPQSFTNTISLRYKRSTVIADIPFEKYDANVKSLYLNEYCGIERWTYTTSSNIGAIYCAVDNCWGFGDTNGPPPEYHSVYVAGLGLYYYQDETPNGGGPWPHYNLVNNIVYYKKNGVICGIQGTVGLAELNNEYHTITISPNPNNGIFTVNSTGTKINEIKIMNVLGEIVNSQQATGNSVTIDISRMDKGIYFVEIITDKGNENRKVVVQ